MHTARNPKINQKLKGTTTMKNDKTTNQPFEFSTETDNTASDSRRLDFTPALIDKSNLRASELIMAVTKRPELFEQANTMMDDGNAQDLIDLILTIHGAEQIKADAQLLDGCDENQLSRLLESRRSDRSKAKKKGPRSNMSVCKTYISSMYAELLIRDYWQKPYAGSQAGAEIDYESIKDDQDAITRKIKSLQSKQCRLLPLAKYDESAQIKLEETMAEIARLNALRPNSRVNTKTAIQDVNLTELRASLANLDVSSLPEDEQAKILALIEKIG